MERNFREHLLAFDQALRFQTKTKPFTFTHFYYYQLMKPFDPNNVFIRDTSSVDVMELLQDLLSIAKRDCSIKKIEEIMKRMPRLDNLEEWKPRFKYNKPRCSATSTKLTRRDLDDKSSGSNGYSGYSGFNKSRLPDPFDASLITDITDELDDPESSKLYPVFPPDSLVEKLRKMYVPKNNDIINPSNPINPTKYFMKDMTRMIYRYETLNLVAKPTMQLSMSDDYYKELEMKGYKYECFASPINSHLKRYFSAFPDTDSCFGSLGSFFDAYNKIETGALCTFDPPYQLNAIEKGVDIALKLNSEMNIKFKMVLPAWTDAKFYEKLQKYVKSRMKLNEESNRETKMRKTNEESNRENNREILENSENQKIQDIQNNLSFRMIGKTDLIYVLHRSDTSERSHINACDTLIVEI